MSKKKNKGGESPRRANNFKDETGTKYGRLNVIAFNRVENGKAIWKCKCECGKITYVEGSKLRNRHTKSCGCFSQDLLLERIKTHGLSKHRAYSVWHGMINRCTYKNSSNYDRYGNKGIKVCDKWRKSFISFINDLGLPEEGEELHRIDKNGNYEPGNCEWIKKMKHREIHKKKYKYLGKKENLSHLARSFEININTLRWRLINGWSIEDAIEIAPQKGNNQKLRKAGKARPKD